jgi:hypothetical protein
MTSLKPLVGALLGLTLLGSPALAQTVGVSPSQIDVLEVVNGSDLAKWQAEKLGEALQGATGIAAAPSYDYVYFVYEGGKQPMEVEGIVLDLGPDLRVERYEMFDYDPRWGQAMTGMEQALWLADHERADPDESRVIEVRNGRIVIISGPKAKDPALVNAVRPVMWEVRGSDWPTHLLSSEDGRDEKVFQVSDQASKHPSVSRALNPFKKRDLRRLRDAGATVTEDATGFRVEHEAADLVVEQRRDHRGVVTLSLSESVAGEAALKGRLGTLAAATPVPPPEASATSGDLSSGRGRGGGGGRFGGSGSGAGGRLDSSLGN